MTKISIGHLSLLNSTAVAHVANVTNGRTRGLFAFQFTGTQRLCNRQTLLKPAAVATDVSTFCYAPSQLPSREDAGVMAI
jgi:hypothetical protein